VLSDTLYSLGIFDFRINAVFSDDLQRPPAPTVVPEKRRILKQSTLLTPPGGWHVCQMHRSKAKGHETHDDICLRLKRAKGHLETVLRMIEEEKDCLDVARQMHAVSKAIEEAKRIFIHDHIDHCLDADALSDKNMSLKDFKEITKYL
jgi:DNA-binding FrmR family transcriptional regulator